MNNKETIISMKETATGKFVNVFVNEMYAILIGIGIGNVLFAQKLDLGNIPDVFMALFVTSVVLLYWWDWTEYLEENIVTTKRELVIDFAILIALELLFGYYNEPLSLIKIFIALSLFNFVWVINHLQEFKKFSTSAGKRWILEKIAAIIFYTAVYFALSYFEAVIPHILQAAVVVLSFMTVRTISFSALRKAGKIQYRKAIVSDIDQIIHINDSYVKTSADSGFLISLMDKGQLENELAGKDHGYYVAQAAKGEIVAFLQMADSAGEKIMQQVKWIDRESENKYKSEPTKYIEKVAVREDYQNKGLGSAFYKFIFKEYAGTVLYAFIVNNPIQNLVSLKFHQKMGFRECGIYEADEYGGLKDYQSVLMLRY
ncbi:GNAT family N-acetyltransferase [candidate division KSB1 bacterium]|nr:GNAT family N-acetyltransferase [candidate division KSB1 bacterium]